MVSHRKHAKAAAVSPVQGEAEIRELGATLIKLVSWIAGGLALIFGWLTVKATPLDELTHSFNDTSITKLALVLFFIGWIHGARSDIRIEQQVYAADPSHGKLSWKAVTGIAGFVAAYFLLLYVHPIHLLFQCVLLAFLGWNIVCWRIILSHARPMMALSRDIYIADGNHFALERLAIVERYMTGSWQVARFVTLAVSVLLQILVVLLVDHVPLAESIASIQINGADIRHLLPYVPGVLFLAYVLLSEGWMNYARGRAFAALDVLDDLAARYVLGTPRRKG